MDLQCKHNAQEAFDKAEKSELVQMVQFKLGCGKRRLSLNHKWITRKKYKEPLN